MDVRDNLDNIKELFVDRGEEVNFFENNLWPGSSNRKVYFIDGEGEIGKTWLLHKFFLECCDNPNQKIVYLDFSYYTAEIANYTSILKEIQLSIDPQAFIRFMKKISDAYQIPLKIETGAGDSGTGIEIGQNAHLERNVITGQVAGRDINNFYFQLNKEDVVREPYHLKQITSAFLEDLATYLEDRTILFLFDDIGGIPGERPFLDSQTLKWLIEDFTVPICNDLSLNARFVITQRQKPDQKISMALRRWTEWHTLTEFTGDSNYLDNIYQEFLQRMEIPAGALDYALALVSFEADGKPKVMYDVASRIKTSLERLNKRRRGT